MAGDIYILGGWQTDFAVNWAREGLEIGDVIRISLECALAAARLEPRDIETIHVGNVRASCSPARASSARWSPRCSPTCGVSRRPSRGRLRVGQPRGAGRHGRDRGRPLRLASVVGVEKERNVPGDGGRAS